MKKSTKFIALAAAIVCVACSSHNGWKVKGNIEGAESGQKAALEGFNGAKWYPIDSLALSSDGSFSYASPEAAAHPDIYRITYKGQTIYFPVDSIETVTITANGANFAQNYTLAGSDNAVAMMEVDRLIASNIASVGVDSTLRDKDLKAKLNETLLSDFTGILAYYIINKTIGNKPLYDLTVRKDLNMLGAIANRFSLYKPNDPRTNYLKTRYLEARKATGAGMVTAIEAPELGYIDMELYDAKGQKKALSQVVDQHPVTLLCFTSFDVETSPAINAALNQMRQKYPQLGIYQVSFDQDEVSWMKGAANLPWTAVRAQDTDYAILQNYNVASIPTVFIIKDGVITERVSELDALPQQLAKQM